MKNMIKKIAVCLLLLAVTTVTVHQTLSYFSSYSAGSGKASVKLNGEVTIDENVVDGNKHIVLKNEGDTDMIVRVRVFYSGDFVKYEYDEDKWVEIDDWWYYKEILKAGSETSELFVKVVKEDAPAYDFQITVVMENERVVYGEDNKVVPSRDDWKFLDYPTGE